jgi:RNA polymerase sigma factor (sigma-70 family)
VSVLCHEETGMAIRQANEVIQHLRRSVLLRDGAGLTDGQLLQDYLSRHDEAALAALVRRHGPMVWGVCRRVLPNHHDAEDAFQATFLVLVRRAASIVSRELLANWLYGVAHQTARKARATTTRRNERERQVAVLPEPAMAEPELWTDLQAVLDAELSRLPDRYRAVVVLCDLQGKTRKEAARQLDVPEGTVASQLTRARGLLARQLRRRGIVLSAGVSAAVLAQKAAAAGVPATVFASTIQAATLFAAGEVTAGAISPSVAPLTEGVLSAMLPVPWKTAATALLLMALVGAGAGGLLYQAQAEDAGPGRTEATDQPNPQTKVARAEIDALIRQLGSAKFAEREAAMQRLKRIGEPALEALHAAAAKTEALELQRRLQQLIDQLENRTPADQFQAGLRYERRKELQKAAALFGRMIEQGLAKAPGKGEKPSLSEVMVHLARVRLQLDGYDAAFEEYARAVRHAGADRRRIEQEQAALSAKVIASWRADVQKQLTKDPAAKALASRYPLILLHSRRYAAGGYLQSAYSFNHETTDEKKHGNDVQLLFDNGGRGGEFQLNMLVNQQNLVADLGAVDFEKDARPSRVSIDDAGVHSASAKAVAGHVYLERIRDDRGNNFYVMFQVLAVGPDSRYMAFVWRRLPGGKVVKPG